MRVLIVEDEALIAMVLADSLEDAGHEVVGPAATMAEALALCEAAAPPPELALLDTACATAAAAPTWRALRERWGVRSIFTSAYVTEAQRAEGVALGRIGKPYVPETVLRCVEVAREVMDGGQPRVVPAGFELFS